MQAENIVSEEPHHCHDQDHNSQTESNTHKHAHSPSSKKRFFGKDLSYRQLQQVALVLSVFSVIYCAAEGGVSIGFGAESSSHALTFFGIQSAIEVGSAAIVLWRFRKVAPPGQEGEVQISPANLKYV